MSKPIDKQPKYVEILAKIDTAYHTLNKLRTVIPLAALKRYREEADILSCYHSNSIEGNTFTYDETRTLIKDGATSPRRTMREHNDIVGHSRAFWVLFEAVDKCKVVDEAFIKELHTMVLQGDDYAGLYRDANVYIGDSIKVSYTAPDATRVPILVSELAPRIEADIKENTRKVREHKIDWANLFLNIAGHHIEFERIHPFFDGNGRTGRLLMNFELIRYGLEPLNITLENRTRYNAAFAGYESKSEFSTRSESKYERMAKLLAECELTSLEACLKMFEPYLEKT